MGLYGSPTEGKRELLGQILIKNGFIKIQAEKGGRLGWIILSQCWVSRLDFFKALAEHFGIALWNLDFEEFSRKVMPDLREKFSYEGAIKYHIISFFKTEDGRLTVLTDYPSESLKPDIERLLVERFGAKQL